jgi:putative membrane protein
MPLGGRRPFAQLREAGCDPDPRFTFANERTFLAWIRTALALIAGGVGMETFAPSSLPAVLRHVIAALLMVLGTACSAAAFRRWLRSELALRVGRPLPTPRLAPYLGYSVAGIAVALLVIVISTSA